MICSICLQNYPESQSATSNSSPNLNHVDTEGTEGDLNNGESPKIIWKVTGEENQVECDENPPAYESLTSPPRIVYNPACKHSFCLPCMDQLLLASTARLSLENESITTTLPNSRALTTTLGSCPFCRCEMSYFNLRFCRDNDLVVSPDQMTTWYEQSSSLPGSSYVVQSSTLYETYDDGLGNFSIHFPLYDASNQINGTTCEEKRSTINTSDKDCLMDSSKTLSEGNIEPNNRPYVLANRPWSTPSTDLSFVSALLNSIHQVEGNEFKLPKQMIFTNIKYYHPTRTFQGDIRPGTKSVIRFILTFSESMSCIARGLIIVVEDAEHTEVVRELIKLGGCTTRRVVYRRVTGFNHHINQRNTFCATLMSNQTSFPESSSENQMNHKANTIQYNAKSIWGNVFCQAFQVGLASYHFLKADLSDDSTKMCNQSCLAYISYENIDAALSWPPLDDGRPIPSQIPFRNITYDEPTHTFSASICWFDEYGTTWQGCSRWDYTMVFDSQYMTIRSGVVYSFVGSPDETEGNFTNHTSTVMSEFGISLIYCNAGLYDYFCEYHSNDIEQESSLTKPEHIVQNSNENTIGTARFPWLSRSVERATRSNRPTSSISSRSLLRSNSKIKEIKTRLVSEGVNIQNLMMIDHLWYLSQTGAPNPIDKNIS